MYATGAMEAKPLCIWCWWATQSGAKGVADLGMRPGLQSGTYSRTLKLVLGLGEEEDETYNIEVPLWGFGDTPIGYVAAHPTHPPSQGHR